jgi:hypothetical protein
MRRAVVVCGRVCEMMRRAGQAARPTTREAVAGRESVRSGDGQAIVLPPKCQRESRAVAAEAWRMGKRDGCGSRQQGGWKKEGFNGSGTAPSLHAA